MCYSVKILVQTFVIADKNQQERNIDQDCTKKNKKQHIWYKFLYTLGRQKRNLIWNNFCPVGFSGAHMRKCSPLVVFSMENTRKCTPLSFHVGETRECSLSYFDKCIHKNTHILWVLRGDAKNSHFWFQEGTQKCPPPPWDFYGRNTKRYTPLDFYGGGTQKDVPPWNFYGRDKKRCPPRGIFTGGTQNYVPPVGFLRGEHKKMSPPLVFDGGENVPPVTHWVVYRYVFCKLKKLKKHYFNCDTPYPTLFKWGEFMDSCEGSCLT